MKINKNQYKMIFTPIKKAENLERLFWVKLDNYLVGLDDIEYKLYIYTNIGNLYHTPSISFLFDITNKLSLCVEQQDYLNELKTKNLVQFNSVVIMEKYFKRLKVINIICC
jgi:hypothetical protein